MCILRVNMSFRSYTHTHTHTYAQTHIRRFWIVLTQSTYTADFYHQPEHLYIAGPYTPLKANQTVAATKIKPYKMLTKHTYRLGANRLGDIRLRDGEGQDEWHRRMYLKWKAVKRRAHPSWLNISGTSVCAKHLCHPSRRHPSRAIRLRGILPIQIK